MGTVWLWVLAVVAAAVLLPGHYFALLLLLRASLDYRKTLIILQMLPRDITYIFKYLVVQYRLYLWKRENATLVQIFRDLVKKHPEKPCFLFEDEIWTYRKVEEFSNKIAQIFHEAGYGKGDTVTLFMENRPEFVCIFLGLAKIGVITAFVNFNLRLQVLIHSITAAKAKGLIFSSSLAPAITDIIESPDLPKDLFELGMLTETSRENVKSLDALLTTAPSLPLDVEPPGFKDKFVCIYTSGTTGMPKAAASTHARYVLVAIAYNIVFGIKPDDIIYNPLPLYHVTGTFVGTGPALIYGNTVVLKKKFSASGFWSDCIRYECTVAHYIGEMCRYLLCMPPKPEDSQHKIRLMLGNGMKAQIWERFVERFKIHNINELYGSTEGNINLVNLTSKIGAIGFLPVFLPKRILPIGLIKIEEETCEPIRNSEGLCIMCEPGEPGMCVGSISERDVTRNYLGYLDKEQSEKKVLHNVFKHGDKAFVSGDILVRDEYGYLYFKDRTGDTFRWKGENVSTAEVEAILSSILDERDATVYGVEVPGQEGKAGMATIADPSADINLEKLTADIDKTLPSYSRPIFLRFVDRLDLTGTFKIKKVELQREAFNPNVVNDRLYVRQGREFIPLTKEIYKDILSEKVRF